MAASVAESVIKGASRYPHMLEPLHLKNGATLRNRVLMGSMHTGLEEAHGGRLEKMAAFYAARAKGGAGLIVTGGVAPNREGWVAPFAAKLSTASEAAMHKEVTEAVHQYDGAKIALQILHSGRYGYHPLSVAPSPIKAPIGLFTPRALSLGGVQSTIDDYARCASLASEAGYDGIEIMGSEGYLINQFIAARTNKRDDEYGGSYSNRTKLAREIATKCRQATNPDFIIVFRLSMLDLVEGGSTWPEVVDLARELEACGVDVINTGIGWHEARVPTIATSVPRAAFTWVTRKLKEDAPDLTTPLCTTNRINMPHTCEEVLARGDADMVSMARPFLADPDIVNKAAEGRASEINTCIGCNQACLDHTFKMMTASCLVNPVAGYETELAPKLAVKTTAPERVAVVGAGPAGLALACTAADRGHHVTLFDSAHQIGGQFNLAKKIPGKEEFYETLRYFSERLKRTPGVTLQLGQRINSSQELIDAKFDKVVLATGITPRSLDIPGGLDHPKVVAYKDVLTGKVTCGPKVAIVGAGGIGFDVAEFLIHHHGPPPPEPSATASSSSSLSSQSFSEEESPAEGVSDAASVEAFFQHWGVDTKHSTRGGLGGGGQGEEAAASSKSQQQQREVYLLQRKAGKPGAGLGKTTGWIHRAQLAKAGVHMQGGVKQYVKVDDAGLWVKLPKPRKGGGWTTPLKEGETEDPKDGSRTVVLDVDHVVVCAGQEPLRELLPGLEAAKVPTFLIGGAEAASELDAKRAIDQGTRLAAEIETAKTGDVFNQPVSWESSVVAQVRKFAGRNH